MDILWEVKGKGAYSVGTMGWVHVWHVVNSRKLTINSSTSVEQVEVLIHSNWAPMGDVDVSFSLSERWKRVWECEEKLDLLECCWGDIGVWTVNQASRAWFCWLVTLVVDIILIYTEDCRARVSWVNTQIILWLKELNCLLFINSYNFRVWLSSIFVEFIYTNSLSIFWWQFDFKNQNIISQIWHVG